MKRFFIFTLTFAILFVLAACGRAEETPMPEDTTAPTENQLNDTGRNVPDSKVNDRSTDEEGDGILDNAMDNAMDKMTDKK